MSEWEGTVQPSTSSPPRIDISTVKHQLEVTAAEYQGQDEGKAASDRNNDDSDNKECLIVRLFGAGVEGGGREGGNTLLNDTGAALLSKTLIIGRVLHASERDVRDVGLLHSLDLGLIQDTR